MPIIQDHLGDFYDSITDHYGTPQYFAPNGEAISVPLFKLVGDSLGGTILDPAVWTASLGTGGTAVTSTGELVLATGTTANNTTSVTSVNTARFSGAAPNKFRATVQLADAGVVNNTRRGGVFTTTNGAFFELSGTTLRLVFRKGSVDTAITNGFFNGQWGSTFTPGTNAHFYEIIYQPRQIVWLADQKIIHTYNSSAAIWTNTMHLPVRFENFNSGGSTTNVSLSVRLAVTVRFGLPQVEQCATFQAGLTAGVVIKNNIGNLHSIILSGVANNAQVILYDNTAASGKIIFDSGLMPTQTTPFGLDMHDLVFNIGLTLVISGAAANCLVMWD